MQAPTVTFVVPCYKLAHLLPDCVNSILSQTYRDLEVLIMDDCSPDDTAEVARSFQDERVRHVRNDPNLGHLRNYNKGIGMARGKYVWLISADDYLRRPYVLERYLEVLEANPGVGYAFCAGVGVRDGAETGTLDYSVCGEADRVIPGHNWLKTILRENVVLAASGLVRRECYLRHGAFPLDMPWAGDWFLWCLLALDGDVAYFAEPMVCYREHALSMTMHLTRTQAETCSAEEIAIPWDIKRRAERAGFPDVARECLLAVAEYYAFNVVCDRTHFGLSEPCLTVASFEASLAKQDATEAERRVVRAHAYAAMGDRRYWRGERALALEAYQAGLRAAPWAWALRLKWALLALDRGGLVRSTIRGVRRALRGTR